MSDLSAEAEQILAKPNHAVVGLNRRGKSPQLTVVWYEWDGTTFRFSTLRSRAKFANIRRDPAISMLVNDPESKTYLVAYGRAEVSSVSHAELSARLFARYLPGVDPGPSKVDPDRVVIALTPDRILTGS